MTPITTHLTQLTHLLNSHLINGNSSTAYDYRIPITGTDYFVFVYVSRTTDFVDLQIGANHKHIVLSDSVSEINVLNSTRCLLRQLRKHLKQQRRYIKTLLEA